MRRDDRTITHNRGFNATEGLQMGYIVAFYLTLVGGVVAVGVLPMVLLSWLIRRGKR